MLRELRQIMQFGKGAPRKKLAACVLHVLLWPVLLIPRLFWPRRGRGEIQRILLIRIDGIGDLAMSSASILALRRKFPNAQIDLLTSDQAKPIADLLAAAKWIDNVWMMPLYDRKFSQYREVARQLAGRRYDVALDLRGDLRNVLLMWLAGTPVRLGLVEAGLSYLLTGTVDLRAPHHESDEPAALVKELGVGDIDPWPRLPLRPEDLSEADRWLDEQQIRRDRPICAMHLSASIQNRVWPLDRFVGVARVLRERHPGMQFLVVGGKGETGPAEDFARELGVDVPVAIAAGRASLLLAAALLSRCTVFIGADSGPGHLAAYAGSAVVTLFSRSSPNYTRPLSPRLAQLVPLHTCDPRCDKICVRPETRCMLDHTVDAVAAAAEPFIRA